MSNRARKPTQKAKPTTEQEENATKALGSVRTSLVLPKTVDANLEAYILRHGSSKGEIITKLLVTFLEQEGYQPFKMPKVEISYE